MSNALAIASVTAVLKDLLDNALIDHSVSSNVGSPVTVSALPPDRIKIGNDEKAQLNLFLYHVAPNGGWRNVGLPARDDRGERLSNPPLALDLFYLLTAYGKADFEGEILLGYAMQMLHETPVLTRDAIRRALAPASPVSGSILPPALAALAASDLAEQIEQIKLCPQAMSNEEMSKLWAATQVSYRPSAAYQASVVLIESRRSTRSALPVRARNLYVVPFRQPTIEQIVSQAGPNLPITSGATIQVIGRQLRGAITLVRVGEIELTPPPENITDTLITIVLPATLRAGVQGVQIVQQQPMGTPPVPHRGVESNVAAFVLRPTVTASVGNVQGSGTNPRSANITVNFTPNVGKNQRVVLLLNEVQPPADRPARAYSFSAPPRNQPNAPDDSASIVFAVQGVMAGTYLVRVQVDGAESPLTSNATTGQYEAPQVTIP